jgi:transposase
MWAVGPLVLTIAERAELERRARAQTTTHRDRQRAEVVLLAADGVPGTQIAPRVGLSEQSVCKWRQQFRDSGLDGLRDAPRSGRPLVYGPTDRLVFMAKVTEEHPEVDSQWSHSELAVEMKAAAIAISASQIGRILAADDVKPHRVQGWLTRRDTPEFWERAADVCGLYLAAPANGTTRLTSSSSSPRSRTRSIPHCRSTSPSTTAAPTARRQRRSGSPSIPASSCTTPLSMPRG